ncbi:MAG: PD40 domain-containing protein [Deltaproteobacteria bacterium]|nr:PD40 domain-containing protein [Deltaproteobacteria bacterium]
MRNALVVCCCGTLIASIGCFPHEDSIDLAPPPPLFEGDPDLENCGYDLAALLPVEVDPCDVENTILQARTENDWVFEDPTAAYEFELPSAGRICVRVINGDAEGGHRPWWGKVSVDGVVLIGRSRLNSEVDEVIETLDLEAGPHEIGVTLYGRRDAFVDVTIGFGSHESVAQDSISSLLNTMVVENLHSDPRIVHQAPVSFSTDVRLRWPMIFYRLGSLSIPLSLRSTFQLSDSECEHAHSLEVLTEVAPAHVEAIDVESTWDGRGPDGEWLEPGDYYLRVVVDLVADTRRGTVLLDRAISMATILSLFPGDCPCVQEVDAPSESEQLIDDESISMEALGCTARVATLWDAGGDRGYRTVVLQESGATCSWNALARRERQASGERHRQQVTEEASALPTDWRGDVIVWYRSGEPSLERDVSRDDVLVLLDDPSVGRISLPEDRVIEISKLGIPTTCIDCMRPCGAGDGPFGDSEYYCPYGMTNLVRKSSEGAGLRIGIHEETVFNQGEAYDERLKDPVASVQYGTPFIFNDFHPNRVASRIWSRGRGLARESDPVSVGIRPGTPSTLFGYHLDALPFFLEHGAHVLNYSAYAALDWEECAIEPTRDFELLQDKYQHREGMLIVQAVGNLCVRGNECLRLTNALTVGGSNPLMSQVENIEYYGGGMEIPNVVGNCYSTGPDCNDLGTYGSWILTPEQPGTHMCGGGNSYNAPDVTALAAMIRGLAMEEGKDAYRPEVLKAIIMASADYRPFLGCLDCEEYDGPDASRLCMGCPGAEPCEPVDCFFGAGFVDGGAAHYLYETDRFEHWDVDADSWEMLGPEFRCGPGCMAKAALAWSNAVDCDDLDCSGDGHVIHDFDLILEQRKEGAWEPVMKAQSRGGTTEWIEAHLAPLISGSDDNWFRYRVIQVSRSVERSTHVGFSSWTYSIEEENRWQLAGMNPLELDVSQDGQTLAFVSEGMHEDIQEPHQSLTLMRADGSCLRHFPFRGRLHTGPSINSDGTLVAYTEHQPYVYPYVDTYSIIRVATVDYDPVSCFSVVENVMLTDEIENVHCRHPSMSSDGQLVAYTSDRGGDYEIYVARSDGTEYVQITFDEGMPEGFITDHSPSLCGDGSVLTWITSYYRGGANDPIAVVRRLDAEDGYSDIAVIDTTDVSKSGPKLSDDCQSIVFSASGFFGMSGPDVQDGLYIIQTDGSDIRLIANGPTYFASMNRNALLLPFVSKPGQLDASLAITTWYGTEPNVLVPPRQDPWQEGVVVLSCSKHRELEYPYAPYYPTVEPFINTPWPLCEYATTGSGDRIFFLGWKYGEVADNVYSIPQDWDPFDPARQHELVQLTFNR